MVEEWRSIPGYDWYEASSQGRIRSLDRSIPTRTGNQFHRGQVLTLSLSGNGYLTVTASPPRIKRYVHDLVAKAFHGDRSSEGLRVLHKHDVRIDNTPENLRWGTQSDNMRDAVLNERIPAAVKPTCVRGHELSGSNLHIRIRNGRSHRVCRECKRLSYIRSHA